MRLLHTSICVFLALCGSAIAQGQNSIDSLIVEIAQAKSDTTKLLLEVELEESRDNMRVSYWDSLAIRSSRIGFKRVEAQALNNVGYIYKHLGEIDKGLEYYMRSLAIKKEMGDKKAIAGSLNNIGIIYLSRGKIYQALDFFNESLSIREALKDTFGMAYSLNNLAIIYAEQGDLDKQEEYIRRSLALREKIKDKKGIAQSLSNLAGIYNYQGKDTIALRYYKKSLKIREEIGDRRGIATSLGNIGNFYDERKQNKEALDYFQRSLKAYEDIGHKSGIVLCSNWIGNIHFNLGNIDKAVEYANRSLPLARELGYTKKIRESAALQSKIYKSRMQYQDALKMFELEIEMRDSIKNEETQKATIRQQTKYEFEKAILVKEQEEKEKTRVLEEETSRRDNLQYSVILISLLVIGGLLAVIGRFSIPMQVAEGLIFFAFLLFFEFLLVLADPYIEGWSGGAPGIKLLFNAGIAALIFPAHAFFESKLKARLAKQ